MDLQQQLLEKQKELAELSTKCSDADCSGHHQTKADVDRMMKYEELEEEVKALQEKITAAKG